MDLAMWIASLVGQSYLFAFLAAAFLGEAAIFILAMLSSGGFIPLWFVFASAFVGTMITDFMWFEIGRRLKKTSIRWEKANKLYYKVASALEKTYGQNHFRSMLISKFMYGVRTANNIYLGGRKKFGIYRFALYNVPVVAIWAGVIVSLGYLAGTGVSLVWKIYNRIEIVLAGVFVCLLIFYLFEEKIRKIFFKRVE
ncbi:MAG: hypothetical protein WCK90_00450 [archaeon]